MKTLYLFLLSTYDSGQNLAKEYYKIPHPSDRAQKWYDESKGYRYGKYPNECFKPPCGHYTQVRPPAKGLDVIQHCLMQLYCRHISIQQFSIKPVSSLTLGFLTPDLLATSSSFGSYLKGSIPTKTTHFFI